MKSVLILGSGYTGRYLKKHIEIEWPGAEIFESSRKKEKDIQFELENESTWSNLKPIDVSFLLFPLSDKSLTERFWAKKSKDLGKAVVCSSTGFFSTEFEDQKVTEATPVDLSNPRVAAEEFLRKNGANLVHAAGIYGPGRNPIDWLIEGRVRPSLKYVNFIQVEDLCRFLTAAALHAESGKRWIAADNQPMRWKSISEAWEKEFNMEFETLGSNEGSKRPSKMIKNDQSIQELKIELKFANVLDGVRQLRRA